MKSPFLATVNVTGSFFEDALRVIRIMHWKKVYSFLLKEKNVHIWPKEKKHEITFKKI